MSFQQLAHAFFDGNEASANRRLGQLVDKGILTENRLLARVLPSPVQPLYVWEPGFPEPAFEHHSRLLKQRWSRLAPRRVTTFMAAERFSRLVGRRAVGRLKHPLQVSHDLGLASVFLFFLHYHPSVALRWVGEDFLAACTMRARGVPDAVIISNGTAPEMAVELGGVYSAKRLYKFHRYCFARELIYEVW